MIKDYYRILHVPKTASFEEIKKMYKKLVKISMPDVSIFEESDANEIGKELNEAYEILSDPKRRELHDRELEQFEKSQQSTVKSQTQDQSYNVTKDPPKPKMSQAHMKLGELPIGVRKTYTFQVQNLGGYAKKINFDYSQPDYWFSIITHGATFPMNVDLHIDTGNLEESHTYNGWIEANLDGITARVTFELYVKSSKVSPRIFVFQSGDEIVSPDELPLLCERYWDEALHYYSNDRFFKNWLIELRRNDLIAKLNETREEKNPNIGLDNFLRFIAGDTKKPQLMIEADSTSLCNYGLDYFRESIVRLHNKGPGWCHGSLEIIDATWLGVSQKEFALAPQGTVDISLKPIPHELIYKGEYKATLQITSNSGNNPHKVIQFQLTTITRRSD